MNLGIYQGIEGVRLTPQTLLAPETKETITYEASGGVWVHRTPRQVIRTGFNRSTPGDIGNSIGIVEKSSLVLTGIIGTDPPYGFNHSQKVSYT